MDDEEVVALAVVLGACVSAIVAVADKRSFRADPSSVSTFSATAFEQACSASQTDWFRRKLRCDKASFLFICRAVRAASTRLPGPNSKHKFTKRVALTMLYLAQGSTMDHAATVLGVSKTRAVVYINETLGVLSSMAKRFIAMPTREECMAVEEGFFAAAGFPGVIGAVDGTLVAISRPHDHEGWYCRKNFPAVNVQAVVDHLGAFRSLSVRSGSNNDQSLWSGSGIKKRLRTFVPEGKHLLGDAGYKLWSHLLTPFPEAEAVYDQRKRTYNKAHSRTRIAVECAFGRLKNRFRILMRKVDKKRAGGVCKVVVSCAVLHNLLILAKDTHAVSGDDPHIGGAPSGIPEGDSDPEQDVSHEQGVAKRDDIAEILASSS